MGITYLIYQTLQQKQFILTFKPSGSNYLFRLNALEQKMFRKCSNGRFRREKNHDLSKYGQTQKRYISSFKWRFYL